MGEKKIESRGGAARSFLGRLGMRKAAGHRHVLPAAVGIAAGILAGAMPTAGCRSDRRWRSRSGGRRRRVRVHESLGGVHHQSERTARGAVADSGLPTGRRLPDCHRNRTDLPQCGHGTSLGAEPVCATGTRPPHAGQLASTAFRPPFTRTPTASPTTSLRGPRSPKSPSG